MVNATGATPKYLTVPEIAEQFRVRKSTVYRWIDPGVTVHGRLVQLKAIQVGVLLRVRPEAVRDFVRLCDPAGAEELALGEVEDRKAADAAEKRIKSRVGLK